MTENSSHAAPFADIFTARPYIFTATAMRATQKSCWAAWVGGPGRELHAEYELATTEKKAEGEYFHWDKAVLVKDDEESTPTCEKYVLENDKFNYIVTVHHHLGGTNDAYYSYQMSKCDEEKGIVIIIFLICDGYENDAKRVFDTRTEMPCWQVRWPDSTVYYYSWIGDVLHMSPLVVGQPYPVMPARHDPAPWKPNIVPNITEMFEFMKTSRLDLGANLPLAKLC